ncbi:MAG: xanthine dehydrogenase family protein molybdopterin-binding subunit [Gemmatimonadaceae bacterium]|nr:xanthine dehydrogenase family protein molybdopterin-binding subunit [Gemmatimonadaceae bacterium]
MTYDPNSDSPKTDRLIDRAIDRRQFIKISGLAGGGLLVASALDTAELFAAGKAAPAVGLASTEHFAANVFVSIAPDGVVTLVAPNSEMGQGIKTSLPMIIAEELDVPWEQVTVVQGDHDPMYGRQFSVGSGSTVANYAAMRRAGAAARAVLIEAAAQEWGVNASECTTADGVVLHSASNRKASYGALATKAAKLLPPTNLTLKDPRTFKLVGSRIAGVDNRRIVKGEPLFGIDVKLPGMLYATYTKCPVFGGEAVSANLEEVKAKPGVRDAFLLSGIEGLPSGVAVVADSTWNAFSATKALKVQWNEGAQVSQSSVDMAAQAETLAKANGAAPLTAGVRPVEAVYHYPFLAHATLEPQNCTAWFKDGVMEMWTPTQIPSVGQGLVVKGLGLAAKNVKVHITRLGGGFGRRGSNEFSLEAAAIAHRLPGTPIKLTWTREQDFAHDNYRSNGWHYFSAGIDTSGKVVALHDAFVKMQGGPGDMSGGGFPFNAVQGSQVRSSKLRGGIPTGFWRAPGDNGNVWATQCFLDELAHAAGKEPLAFTLDMLGGVASSRFDASKMIAVLKLAAEKANWGQKRPRGEGQGFAICFANSAYVAVVADVSVSRAGELKIKKLTAAVDAGTIVNASGAEAQVQGSMLDGISAAWFQKVTIERGAAAQTNFNRYPMMRMQHAPPVIDVHFIKSMAPPTGLGEPALPPAAPAVCNAIFAATGKRIRTLPFADESLKWG